ncbi:gibberellin 2-beta-dioxygenase 8 [Macadamia integrifolia]|uniref:gibberellin 2-beta-dioxygenase 8 n=1 Tax=Macadamia integrifolia TaxID=60698 RepID=UPI001C4E6BAC|nr:gibberellin 2-beta-dioxygenase 8 [Macadamia integrifolia]XP_042486757.1 gibberellin 2-beta-dioxygenase 8 [Macadamia integrifolia]
MDSEPPFQDAYKSLLEEQDNSKAVKLIDEFVEDCEVPVIDLSRLNGCNNEADKEECKKEIAKASKEWGFFQVVNHGIPQDVLQRMRREQVKLFRQPFQNKAAGKGDHKVSDLSGNNSYRWGTPTATCLKQLSWTEAFHIPITDVSNSAAGQPNRLSLTIKEFASTVSSLAQTIAEILAENLGLKSAFFTENCWPNTCYLRMNRYPPCPLPLKVFGLLPHTDSNFLTILYQDQVGGLQLVKDGRWVTVKPNPEALIINIGDLFQAWSNDAYKSVKHRVVTNGRVERFSVAYFFCPSYDTIIQSCKDGPRVYRKFSFREYREQVQEDVRTTGNKVGLPRFLLSEGQ